MNIPPYYIDRATIVTKTYLKQGIRVLRLGLEEAAWQAHNSLDDAANYLESVEKRLSKDLNKHSGKHYSK